MPYQIAVRHRPARRPGMGDWGSAVTELIAQDELGRLNSAVRALIDKLIAAINSRAEVLSGYQEAAALFKDAQAQFGAPMINAGYALIPNPAVLPSYTAFGVAVKGVQVFAREVQTLGFLDRVFTQVSASLTRAGLANDANSIDQALAQIRRFNLETDNMFFRAVPEYNQTKQQILAQAKAEWAALGVAANAYDDPKWMAGYIRAANAVVPVEDQPGPPEAVAQAGLGELTLLGSLLIWVIGIVVAGLVISSTLSRILPDVNAKARTAEKLALAYQQQRADVAAQMRADGKSEDEIKQTMREISAEEEEAYRKIPESPSWFNWKWVVGIVAALGGGYVAAKMTRII